MVRFKKAAVDGSETDESNKNVNKKECGNASNEVLVDGTIRNTTTTTNMRVDNTKAPRRTRNQLFSSFPFSRPARKGNLWKRKDVVPLHFSESCATSIVQDDEKLERNMPDPAITMKQEEKYATKDVAVQEASSASLESSTLPKDVAVKEASSASLESTTLPCDDHTPPVYRRIPTPATKPSTKEYERQGRSTKDAAGTVEDRKCAMEKEEDGILVMQRSGSSLSPDDLEWNAANASWEAPASKNKARELTKIATNNSILTTVEEEKSGDEESIFQIASTLTFSFSEGSSHGDKVEEEEEDNDDDDDESPGGDSSRNGDVDSISTNHSQMSPIDRMFEVLFVRRIYGRD